MNKNCTYTYYWYDHLMLRSGCKILDIYLDANMVQDAIAKHDWDRFRLYKFLLDTLDHYSTDDEKMEFLPNFITCYSDDEECYEIELNKDTFMMITDSEYECG